MKQHISWQKLKGDTVNGFGVQIIYTFTSFDTTEIEGMEKFCKDHIKDGLIFNGVRLDEHIGGIK